MKTLFMLLLLSASTLAAQTPITTTWSKSFLLSISAADARRRLEISGVSGASTNSVVFYGADPSGVTNSVAAFLTALSLPPPRTILIPAGTYNLTNWTQQLLGGVNLVGDPENTFLIGNSNVNFISTTGTVYVSGICFTNWLHPFYNTSVVDRISIRDCCFLRTKTAIYHQTNGWIAASTSNIRWLDFDNNTVDGQYGGQSGGFAGVYLRAAHGSNGAVVITRNTFVHMNSPSIKLGDNVEDLMDTWQNADISANQIGPSTNSFDNYGILLYGKDTSITRNYIHDMLYSATQEASGIYVKCRNYTISYNHVVNCGGVQGAITVKGVGRHEVGTGVGGYSGNISFNHVKALDGRQAVGIYLDEDSVVAEGNFVEGFSGQPTRRTTGFYIGDCQWVKLLNNFCINNNSFRVIDVQGSSEITIDGTVIDGVTGLPGVANQLMFFGSGGRMTNVTVKNTSVTRYTNQYATDVGLYFQSAVTNFTATGNTFPIDLPIAFFNVDGAPSDQIRVTDNFFPDTTNSNPQKVYFAAGTAPVHALIGDNLQANPNATYGVFADGDQNPNVGYRDGWFDANNSSPTTYTNFSNGFNGQEIGVYAVNGNTTIQHLSTAIKTKTAVNTVIQSGTWMFFKRRAGVWHEINKSSLVSDPPLTLVADNIGTPVLDVVTNVSPIHLLRIDHRGYLVIGPGSPQVPFEILTPSTSFSSFPVHAAIFDKAASPFLINSGGSLVFGGIYDSSQNSTHWAGIRGLKYDSVDGNYGGSMAFYTRPNAGAETERIRIGATGLVGIGTNSPTDTLHVHGTFKLVDGSQGASKVLTSDADGLAAWVAPTASFTNGQVTVIASASTAYYTNSLISTNWSAFATVNSADATAFSARAIPGTGFLTVEVNAPASSDTVVSWLLVPGVYIAVVADFLVGQDDSPWLGEDSVQLIPQ